MSGGPDARSVRPGTANLITDVAGLRIGNAEDDAVRTGVTAVIPDAAAVAAVDVRGGAPGTRESDVLTPASLVQTVDAIVLSGGSAFGLGSASGVQDRLARDGRGYPAAGRRVPIVPAAILFDLGNGGDKSWIGDAERTPYYRLGAAAYDAAARTFDLGARGAGRGAVAGSRTGGLGSASAYDPITGATVGAIVAVNSFGEVVDRNGHFWAGFVEQNGEFGGLGPPPEADTMDPAFNKGRFDEAGGRDNTTIAAVATDADLTRVEALRLAIMAQDGLARAIRPAHTPFDGDTVFALSTARVPAPGDTGLARIGSIAADCLSRAVARGVFETTPS